MDMELIRDFPFRAARVLREIAEGPELPDLICLQEIDHYKCFYKPGLEELGYESRIAYRRGIDGVLVGW